MSVLRRERSQNPVSIMPGDEITVTTNRPLIMTIVQEYEDEPVDVWVEKEWGTLSELRQEIQMLRRRVKQLTFRLEEFAAREEESES